MLRTSNFNQWDARWGSKLLSPSGWTLGNSGCFITSFTNALPNFSILRPDGSPLDPSEVLAKLIAVDGLNLDGLMTYDGIMRAFPSLYFHERVTTTNDPRRNEVEMQALVAIEKVRRLLDLGQPTILCVDNLGKDGIPDHAILAVDYVLAKDGTVEDFLVHDPDGGREILFSSKYGPPQSNLYGYVAIIGPPSEFPQQSTDREDGIALWKATQIRRGINVATYTKELIDTLL